MFHGRYLNAEVNKIHERALKNVYKDTHANYEALFKLDNAVSIHQCNLKCLLTEIYKTKNSLNPSSMRESFLSQEIYSIIYEIKILLRY